MQNTTLSRPRSQWGSSTSRQVLYCRPGLGVRVRTTDLAARLRARPPHLEGTVRGKVVGFSKESAARLRRFLFGLDFTPDRSFGLALTSAPWVVQPPEQAFKQVGRHLDRCPHLAAAVWRKEVTQKGVPHYHLVVWADKPENVLPVWAWITSAWVDALLVKGVCPGVAYLTHSRILAGGSVPADRASWIAAGRYALERVNCRFSLHGKDRGNLVALDRASGVQYLCDHTSKHKACQAATTGRTWGVWNRSRLPLVDVPGVDLETCPLRLLADIRKALGKMSRYWWPIKDAPFGYRWSRPRHFTHGDKVLFRPAAPQVIRRLVDAWNAQGRKG